MPVPPYARPEPLPAEGAEDGEDWAPPCVCAELSASALFCAVSAAGARPPTHGTNHSTRVIALSPATASFSQPLGASGTTNSETHHLSRGFGL